MGYVIRIPQQYRNMQCWGCNVYHVMGIRRDDGLPRFASYDCSLSWHRENRPAAVRPVKRGFRDGE